MSDKTRNEWQNRLYIGKQEMSDKTRNEWLKNTLFIPFREKKEIN
jgi:hypothetical protein